MDQFVPVRGYERSKKPRGFGLSDRTSARASEEHHLALAHARKRHLRQFGGRGMSGQPRELLHFLLLDPAQQAEAIRRMAAQGWSDHGIAAATRLSVEQVRRVLAGSKSTPEQPP